jgi:hypothetical protein
MPEQPASVPTRGSRSRNVRLEQDGQPETTVPPDSPATQVSSTDEFASGNDFLIVNSPMEANLFIDVVRAVTQGKVNKGLVLSIVTWGGSADEAYRVGRYLQSAYDRITAFVPACCKSAGTLLAIAANSLIMSPFGELGPLDVQLRKKDEIFGRRSGLITRAAISDLGSHTFEMFENFMLGMIGNSYGSVSFKMAADISAKMSSEIMSKIYEQINPDSLGQDFRDLSVATKYCERLARWSGNISNDGIRKLVHDYPSHDFVIDSEEAKEIFVHVDLPTPTIDQFFRDNISCLVKPRDGEDVVIKLIDQGGQNGRADNTQEKSGATSGQPGANGRDASTTAPTP